jgi:hypothetical protein
MNRTELLRQSYKKAKQEKAAGTEVTALGPVKKRRTPPAPKAGRPVGSTTAKAGGPKTNRTCHLALRVTEETAKAVEQAAYDTHRTGSNWVECAILWALSEGAVKTRQLVPRPKGGK